MSIKLFDDTSIAMSRKLALNYSTSFSLGIRLLSKDNRWAVFSIYGLVRVADEIVDTFHGFNKERLLSDFKAQTYQAIEEGISTNPVLHAFQLAANQFGIGKDLIEPFFNSMEEDLDTSSHNAVSYSEYIYGSAEVVGLMCLFVFCDGDKALYETLKPGARSLGAAFQKVNFLRDLKADFEGLERVYFPGCDFRNFTENDKQNIEIDIQKDFDDAYAAILNLPVKSKFGVYVAYKYYLSLFKKIKQLEAQRIMQERIRIPDYGKMFIVAKAGLRSQLNIL